MDKPELIENEEIDTDIDTRTAIFFDAETSSMGIKLGESQELNDVAKGLMVKVARDPYYLPYLSAIGKTLPNDIEEEVFIEEEEPEEKVVN